MPQRSRTKRTSTDEVNDLIYKLLDAHADTTRLADDLAADPRWSAHLGYLRDLQRVSREILAGFGLPGPTVLGTGPDRR